MADFFVLIVLGVIIYFIIWDQISIRKTKPQNLPPTGQEKHSANAENATKNLQITPSYYRQGKGNHSVRKESCRTKEREVVDFPKVIEKYSHSLFESFEECPRKFFYRYIQRIDPAFQSIEAFTGSNVHEALKWAYKIRESHGDPSVDKLLEYFEEIWMKNHGSHVRIIKSSRGIKECKSESYQMLKWWHKEIFKKDELETLDLECEVDLDMYPFRYHGFIDRKAIDTSGNLYIIDYKTTRRQPTKRYLDEDLQLRSYAACVSKDHLPEKIILQWQFLNLPKVDHRKFSKRELRMVIGKIEGKIKHINRQQNFHATPSVLCKWCGYSEGCEYSLR